MSTTGSSTTLESVFSKSASPHTVLSSIAGFSRPSNKRIHTLEDLLKYVQTLGLPKYDYSQLQVGDLLGEGASYRVFGCVNKITNEAVAVKRVKLPPSSTKFEAFEHRVSCVLRDIEVMQHGSLKEHNNILRLLGCGWNYMQGDTIPFLVTPIASEGTLRQYLRRTSVPLTTRFQLCGDVCAGIYELHLSGVAHGDVKLDNVLVNFGTDGTEPHVLTAMISDFGHSVIVATDNTSLGPYRGTPGYEPPETHSASSVSFPTDFRKCDLWALGLACWELVAGGKPYYEDARIQAALVASSTDLVSPTVSGTNSGAGSHSNNESVRRKLRTIAEQIPGIALDSVEDIISGSAAPEIRAWCSKFFASLLAQDPDSRSAEALHLPIFHDRNLAKATFSRPQLLPRNAAETGWSFEIFKPWGMAQSPSSALAKIKQDFQFMIGHQDPIQAARSGLHLAFAYACGFGVPGDPSLFSTMLEKCVPDALPIISALTILMNDAEWNSESKVSSIRSYARFVQRLLKIIRVIPRLDGIGLDSSYSELEIASASAAQALGSSAIPAPIYAVHHGLTHKMLCKDQVDYADPLTGETALIVACRMGNAMAAHNLLSCGANASKADINGRLPLHWLFMFEPSEIVPMATRLTRDWSIQHINSPANNAYVPDIQFPLVLHGTPLAFAVAACSVQATQVLLGLGADPRCGSDIPDLNWGCRSPLAIAASLHLYDIFSMLWNAMFLDRSYTKPIDSAQLDLLACGMSNTSKIERYLVHGRHYQTAARRMASLLRGYRCTIIEETTNNSSTGPLEAAVTVMDWEIAGALLKNFYLSNSEAKDWLFFFALQVACRGTLTLTECKAVLDFAVERGADINAFFDSSGRAIDILIAQHQGKILGDWLLPKKPQVTVSRTLFQERQLSPLWTMIENGLSKVVRCANLLSLGADPKEFDPQTGDTLLHLAVESGTNEDVSSLLSFGASPWLSNFRGNTPWHDAVRKQDVELVSVFLNFIDTTALIEMSEITALTLAASLPNNAIVALLLERGAVCGAEGTTALHAAADAGNVGALKILIPAARSLDPHDSNGYTPLHRALQSRQQDRGKGYSCACLLLEAGADANAIDHGSVAAIHMVFRHFHGQERLNMIQKLQSHGAQLDRPRSDGTTILHLAAFMNDVPMVRYLLQEGISPDLRGIHGQTPLHDCVRSNLGKEHVPTTAMLSDACCVIQMLAKAGESIPYRPNLKSFGQGTATAHEHTFTAMANAHGNERLENPQRPTLNLKKAWKSRQTRVAAERKKEQYQRDNRIEGYGISLFRDINYKLPVELAAQRGSDQKLLQCLLDIHQAKRNHGSESESESSCRSSSSSAGPLAWNEANHLTAIQAGWAAAIRSHNWPAVKHLLLQELKLVSILLEWPVCDRLLIFGVLNTDTEILNFFTGHGGTHLRAFPWQKELLLNLETTNEFSVDLCYLWDITRVIKKSRTRAMKVPVTTHKKFPFYNKIEPDDCQVKRREQLWGEFPILINSKDRSRMRQRLSSAFERATIPRTSGQGIGSCLEQLQSAWNTICNTDLQTLNLRLGNIEKTQGAIPFRSGEEMDDTRKVFPGNNNTIMKKLLSVIGSYDSTTLQADACYSCAPGRTSTSLRLLCEVWGSNDQDPKRMKTLTEILLDYQDIWEVLKDEAIVRNYLYFETTSDRTWFNHFVKCIEAHIAFLRRSLEKEMKKTPIENHSLDAGIRPLNDHDDRYSLTEVESIVVEISLPQRPRGPPPPEEDDVSIDNELDGPHRMAGEVSNS